MVDPKLNPTATIFTPTLRLFAYMNDEMIFTNKTLFECFLGKYHEYTFDHLAEINGFIARGRANGYFHEVEPGVYRASWEHLILRAEEEKEILRSRPVDTAKNMIGKGELRQREEEKRVEGDCVNKARRNLSEKEVS